MNEKKLIWNPYAGNYFENPHEYISFWRERNPVHKGVNRDWFLFKYDDVKFLLTDPAFKTWKTHNAVSAAIQYLKKPDNFDDLAIVFGSVLLFQDAPEHLALRNLILKIWNSLSFTEVIQTAVEEILKLLEGKGEIDLVQEYARRVPTEIIIKILGLPIADYGKITFWSHQFISALEPFVSLNELREYNIQARRFREYLKEIISLKRARPDDFFISKLLAANETLAESLADDEIISLLCMIFFAGIETSVNLLGQSVLLLISNPEQIDLVIENDQLSTTAINELIRCVSPVNYTKRVAMNEVEIRGAKINAGESIFGAIISANFDEDVFKNPKLFDLTRSFNPHLGFGSGAHFCLGARLGREQISRTLPALFRRYPKISLRDGKTFGWEKLVMNRALKSFPVILKG